MDQRREIEEKVERVVRLMHAEGLAGALVNAQHNFAWLTRGGTNGVDQSREAGVGTLLLTRDGRRFLLANRIEVERLLAEEVAGQGYEPVEFGWEEERASPTFVAERALALLDGGGPLGSDLPAGGATRVIEAGLSRARQRLTAEEVERYRALGRDAGEALGEVARSLVPGLTESEIARRAADAVAARGARSVVTLVAADERLKRFRHPVPTTLAWEKVVMVVVCARRGGLFVSLTRLVSAGPVPEDLQARTRAAAQVNAELYAATREGATGRELYAVAARAYARAGFPGEERLHHQGGASGYRTREWVAHPASEERVMDCQAFAWNPSVTGTKVEETCLARGGATEVITASPGWPQVRSEAGGREYFSPGVLALGAR